MKKLHTGWIVFIVFCSLLVIGGIFYLFYRLYINHIYKRKRPWCEITSPLTRQSKKSPDNKRIFLMPRQSLLPLLQDVLPREFKKQSIQRKMITELQFNEPPLFASNLKVEWDEMDRKSLFSSQSMSPRTSYYTIEGCMPCEDASLDERSSIKYYSLTSSDDFFSSPSSSEHSSQKQSPLQLLFNPFVHLSERLFNREDKKHIIPEMKPFQNISQE